MEFDPDDFDPNEFDAFDDYDSDGNAAFNLKDYADVSDHSPTELYRLGAAVINQALKDYVTPIKKTPYAHKVGARLFLLDPLSQVWFRAAKLDQRWFLKHLCSYSSESWEMLEAVTRLTDYSEFAYHNTNGRLVPIEKVVCRER